MYVINCNGANYTVHENTIVRLNLLSDNVSCENISSEVSYWNDYYKLYNKCVNMFCKKLVTRYEFELFLKKNTEDQDIIDNILEELATNNIVNDDYYEKSFVEMYLDNPSYSSLKVEKKLSELGIILSIENKEKLEFNDIDKAYILVEKFKKTHNCQDSYIMYKNKCVNKLKQNMYSSTVIFEVVGNIEYDEKEALLKVYAKLKDKFDANTIIKKLYSKGFKSENINSLKEELDD